MAGWLIFKCSRSLQVYSLRAPCDVMLRALIRRAAYVWLSTSCSSCRLQTAAAGDVTLISAACRARRERMNFLHEPQFYTSHNRTATTPSKIKFSHFNVSASIRSVRALSANSTSQHTNALTCHYGSTRRYDVIGDVAETHRQLDTSQARKRVDLDHRSVGALPV